jgi:hypothetical protein
VWHSAEHIRPLLVEVLLGLKDGPADQGVEPTFDLRNAALKIEMMKLDAEFLDQQLAEICLHLIMPGAPGEVPQQIGRAWTVNQDRSLGKGLKVNRRCDK